MSFPICDSINIIDATKKLCRSCLSNAENMENIFESGYVEAFVYITSLPTAVGDGLPTTLCRECISLITKFYNFKQQCTTSYDILSELAKEMSLDIKDEEEPQSDPGIAEECDYDSPVGEEHDNSCDASAVRDVKQPQNKVAKENIKTEETNAINKPKTKRKVTYRLGDNILSNIQTDDRGRMYCKICNKVYMRRDTLICHIRIHLGLIKDQECKICGRMVSFSNFKNHVDTHSGEKPFKCDQCGKCFKLKQSAKIHMLRHDNIRNFMCSICGKLLCSKSELRVHTEYHSTEKPHKCSVCSKGFKRLGLLTTHEKIHSGKRLYACSMCPKSFKTRAEKRLHELTHGAEKEHVCQICNKAFLLKGRLTRHMRTHQRHQP